MKNVEDEIKGDEYILDLELEERRREVSLYLNNTMVLSVEHGVTLGLLKLIYSSHGKFKGRLQGVKTRPHTPSAVASVVLSDDRVLDKEEYELIVDESIGNFAVKSSSQTIVPLPSTASTIIETSNDNNSTKKIGEFVCEYCHLPFVSRAKFQRHRRIHTESNPYMCVHCDASFPHHRELRKHRELVHSTDKTFKCTYCPKTFATRAELSGHTWRHTGEKEHKCRICGKAFATKGNLKLHIDKHIGIHKHKCPFCPQRFTSHSSLEGHMGKHTGMKAYKCRFCEKSYSQAGQLTAHERLHTGEKPFVCEVCGRGFRLNATRLAHEKRHSGVRPHICETCGRSFALPEHLHRHLKTHENRADRLVSCPFCKKKIFAGRNIQKHLVRHRELNLTEVQAKAIAASLKPDKNAKKDGEASTREGKQAVRCEECNADMKSVRKLIQHLSEVHYDRDLTAAERKQLRIRHGVQKCHECKVCSEYFVDYRLLKSHMLLEHGESLDPPPQTKVKTSEHKCPNCALTFELRASLDDHIMREHFSSVIEQSTDEVLQFTCWYCNKVCESPEDVVSHMTHQHASLDNLSKRVESEVSSSGLWTCKDCSATLKSEEEYKEHLLQHTKNTSSECVVAKYLKSGTCGSNEVIVPVQTEDSIRQEEQVDNKDGDKGNGKNQSEQVVEEAEVNKEVVMEEGDELKISEDVEVSMQIDEQPTCSKTVAEDAPKSQKKRKKKKGKKARKSGKKEESVVEEANVESTTEKGFQCWYCSIRFTRPDEVVQHMTNNHENLDNLCRQVTTTPKKKVMNDATLSPVNSDDHLRCNICSRTLSSKEAYELHIMAHEVSKRNPPPQNNSAAVANEAKPRKIVQLRLTNKCTHCSRVFCGRKALDVHIMKMHGREYLKRPVNTPSANPFTCWFCSTTFTSPEQVVAHMTSDHENLERLSKRIEAHDPKPTPPLDESKQRYIAIAPRKEVLPLPPATSDMQNIQVTAPMPDLQPKTDYTESAIENLQVPPAAGPLHHQPPPGFKVSYALAYVPVLVPENEDEDKQ